MKNGIGRGGGGGYLVVDLDPTYNHFTCLHNIENRDYLASFVCLCYSQLLT